MVAGGKSVGSCLLFECQANIRAALSLCYYANFELLNAHRASSTA
jgi:hypothetical protein